MAKKFNITGTCYPDRHYMADTSEKLRQIFKLVEEGEYFTINRPRQYGKTTLLAGIANLLNASETYLAFNLSFEGLGTQDFKSDKDFCQIFLSLMEGQAELKNLPEISAFLKTEKNRTEKISELSGIVTRLAGLSTKRTVLLIDEVDKSTNNQLFLDFLGMLRNKFLNSRTIPTFHSVILAGVHDVKSLKLKIRSEGAPSHEGEDMEGVYNSPWNIAADFKVDLSLFPSEIAPMLDAYCADKGVEMDTQAIADALFYYTSGYPFLVSKLCKMLDEELLPGGGQWTPHDVERAASLLVRETNTNFESLIKNLENNKALYDLVFRMIIENDPIYFNIHDPLISTGLMYGVFRNGQGLHIHNRIYAEIIAGYMASKMLTSGKGPRAEVTATYLLPGNALNMDKVLTKFQEYMREEYNKRERDFLERNARLVFLAFLKPIINGFGYSFKEPQISEERRLDVVVTFYQHRYLIELKVWRGEAAHKKGLEQLAEYMDAQNFPEGYLLIFDHSNRKSWKQEELTLNGKRVRAVWV
jgi:hypothetical protein